tara:strand:+ start:1629 stop:2069 length:441 start_codon:yes stop_codon:yes gene_type:complete
MMLNIENLFTRKNIPQLVLAIMSVFYILGDILPPHNLAGLIATPLGVAVLIASAVLLSRCAHPVVTVVYLIAIYELYERSRKTHVRGTEQKLPVDKRQPHLTHENQFPVTLEEKVVKKMAPWVMKENHVPPSFKPVLDNDMNASEL